MNIEAMILKLARHYIPASIQASIHALEKHDQLSTLELAALTRADHSTICHTMKRLRDLKLVYICEYRPPQSAGQHSPIYALGNRPDAVKPEAKPSSVASKKRRDKIRAIQKHQGMWGAVL